MDFCLKTNLSGHSSVIHYEAIPRMYDVDYYSESNPSLALLLIWPEIVDFLSAKRN